MVAAAVAAPLLMAAPQPVDAKPRAEKHKASKKKWKARKSIKRIFSRRHYQPRKHYTFKDACIVLDPEDRDLIVRTVMGEANSEPYNGKVGVAAVVLNRLRSGEYGGNTVKGVLFAPKQFEPWNTRRGELMRYSPNTRGWAEAEAAVDDALNGNDPTNGATHFANVDTVRARGNSSALGWLRGMSNVTRFEGSGHTFGNADGKGSGKGIRTLGGGSYRGDALEGLGLGGDDDDFGDTDSLLGAALATLSEETDDPRRMAVRSLMSEILEGLTPPTGQGQAVAPESEGVAEEDEEGLA